MTFKGVLAAGVAVLAFGFAGSSAQAAERLSLYEINAFVTNMTDAVNNPNPHVTRSFLDKAIDSQASFHDTLNSSWIDGRYYQAWNGQYVSPYYRYPHARPYLSPVSQQVVGKHDMIGSLDYKKSMIPHYHQTVEITGTKMPADASSAVVDVRLKEFGLSYHMAPYGAYYGQQVQHADSRCQLYLKKDNSDVKLTRMTCNTLQRTPL